MWQKKTKKRTDKGIQVSRPQRKLEYSTYSIDKNAPTKKKNPEANQMAPKT